ncbi:RagB/SusD family nutrient uptake outer membrane protein [Carboxylicivirga sediminis]|uniref:RagB/SusD family nutrient uptake outer membrane protein n=1 Tax=Carboxylicivirga sediminis TaxID=2006564 RepID=A0A941IZ39_9BACT|nr:RagB/SusD family nutrient uptake outer membrane protein [Carboxylicivirga sediminis]MBR8537208.1 RagB/SusD family nutrient uptake outer membrane protein [Carboxylicivirga sediminis]
MKNLYIIVLLIGLFASCTNELEQLPSGSLPGEEAISNVNDLNKAVNGVYSTLVHRYGYAGDYGIYADGKGGDVQLRDLSANHFQPIVIFQTDANSGVASGIYQRFYYTSARANNVMLFLDGISDKDENKEEFESLVGQLYAIRALCHFELARTYAQLPGVAADLNAQNSGIVLNDAYYGVAEKFKRSTLKETYDFIVADLEKAIPLLSEKKVEASGKINQWAAKALLSRVYLYLGEYDSALELAHDVIDNSDYALYTQDNYLSVWAKTGTSESLFELTVTDNENAQRNSLGYYTNPDGYAECSASDIYAEWLLEQTDDIRSQSIREKDLDGDYLAYYTVKYEGQEGTSTPLYTNNAKVIRLSEVYLIAAEAKLKGGVASGSNDAVWYYNELRKNRINSYVDAVSVNLDEILDERRRELFCENHRMFDLVRNKKSITSPSVGNVHYDDYRIIVAIPQRERDISPELAQNPKY